MQIVLHGATKIAIKIDIYKYINQKDTDEQLSNSRTNHDCHASFGFKVNDFNIITILLIGALT